MRTKPLLQPVVAAFERQQAINLHLLQLINELRSELGYDEIPMSYVQGVIDDNGDTARVVSDKLPKPQYSMSTPAPQSSSMTQSTGPVIENKINEIKPTEKVKPTETEKLYAEHLQRLDFSDTLGYGADKYDLYDEVNCYIFTVSDDEAIFELNPDMAEKLMRHDNRLEWKDVVETGEIPECPENMNYVIETITPGKAKLLEGYYVITSKTTILIKTNEK